MTDPRSLADEAVLHLDRLSAVILDDVGDGPPPRELAANAAAARDAIAPIGVSALTQLSGLVAGVADSMVDGTTDWSPSLGGTLLAAIDDLRHLVARAAQFSDEDSEHLHHRAAELSVYVRTTTRPADPVAAPPPAPPTTPAPAPPVVILSAAKDLVPGDTLAAPPTVILSDSKGSSAGEVPQALDPSLPLRMTGTPFVPISQLFYADQGPHVVSGGVPKAAGEKSDRLGRGIDALENLTAQPLAKPITVGVTAVVPVEKLLYRGRAALERAAAIREHIMASGAAAAPAALDEMYDLIGLALKD